MRLDKFSGGNVRISPTVKIGKNVKIGDNTVFYDNVEIGDNTIICNDCVIGEPLNDYYYLADAYENPKTIIGANSLIRSHTIIYADNKFGEGLQTGHRVTIREKTVMGVHCSVGTLSDIQGHSVFGDYVRMHSNVHIGHESKIGSYCWIYPYTVFTNDPTPPSDICVGPTVGDYSIVATHCLLLPGGESRGAHAHRELEQLIVAASGSFTVTLDDGKSKRSFFLNRPYQGLYVKPGLWRDLEDFSSGAVCMVLASEVYQKEDYIKDYDEFLKFREEI